MPQRAPLHQHSDGEGDEEKQSDENKNGVEIQRGITPAQRNEGDRAQKKNRCAVKQSAAERNFGGGGAQTTNVTDVGFAVCPAVEAAGHFVVRLRTSSSSCSRSASGRSLNSTPIPLPGSTRRT